jgi:hypothetical protein
MPFSLVLMPPVLKSAGGFFVGLSELGLYFGEAMAKRILMATKNTKSF